MSKLAFTVLVLIAFALAVAPVASARSIAPYDSSYASGGTLRLSKYGSRLDQVVQRCELLASGKLGVAGRFGGGELSKGIGKLATAVVNGYRKPRTAYLRTRWHGQRVPAGEDVIWIDFNADGSAVYLTGNNRGKTNKVHVFRIGADGRAKRSFGGDGEITVSLGATSRFASSVTPRATALSDGGVLFSMRRDGSEELTRFDRNGDLATTWASGGKFAQIAASTFSTWTPVIRDGIALETADGGLIVGAADVNAAPGARRAGLLKLTANGAVDSSFGIAGLWLPPLPAGTAGGGLAYTQPGQTLQARLDPAGRIVVSYADLATNEVGTEFDFRLATVGADGQLVWSSPVIGEYFNGGDGGFPNSHPLVTAATADGAVFATGETYYGPYPGTYRGFATRWRTGATTADAHKSFIGARVFAADDFAPTADGHHVYACGSIGSTGKKAKPPWQRKRVALRRIEL